MTGAALSQKIVKGRFRSPSQSTYAKFIIRVCASTAADDSGKMDLFVAQRSGQGDCSLLGNWARLKRHAKGPSLAMPAFHGHELLFPREIIGSRLVSRIICTTFDTSITS